MLVLAACTSTGEIEGHQIRGTAVLQPKVVIATDLHADAPQWFKDRWRQYLERSDGNYAVLAADRNSRGTGFVYCDPAAGGLCKNHQSWSQAFKDVNYKNRAINICKQDVRNDYPAFKPECAIYAIVEKIVWKGPMPWD